MKSFKKATSILLIAVLALSILSGCGTKNPEEVVSVEYVKDENLNKPGTFPVCKEKITLTIGIPKSALITDYENNTYTQKLEELMNCDLKFEYLPSSDTMQKVELMMASGGDELPDIICGVNFTDGALLGYGESGMIVPLNAYYENSAYYLKEALKEEEDLKNMITLPDGKMYYVPRYNKALPNELGCTRAWVNKKWLDAVGMDVPTTTKDFKKMLKAFKEKDPNGNGKADELAFSGYTSLGNLCGLEYIFGSFVKFTPKTSYLYVDGKDKVQAGYMQDGWKEAIKYCADLYKDGLISDSTFTLDSQSFKPIKNNPGVPILGSFVSMSLGFNADVQDRYNEYVPLPPLKHKKKDGNAVWVPTVPATGFVITKNCKYPEAAFMLGDIMCSPDMSLSNRWGEKDVDWVYASEDDQSLYGDIGYDAVVKMINDKWGVTTNAHWNGAGPTYRGYPLSLGQVASENNFEEASIAESTKLYLKSADMTDVKKFVYDMDCLAEANELNSSIESYVKEMTTLFVVGEKNVDKEWNQYIDELKNMGIDTLIEYTQAAYDKTKK